MTTINGYQWIPIQVPGTGSQVANWLLTVTVAGQTTGDIYDVVVSTNALTASSIGTTTPVAPTSGTGTSGSPSTVLTLTNGETLYLSVTDLFEQWTPTSNYTLPETLGLSTSVYSPGSLTAGVPQSEFTLSYTLSNVPEPASMSLLIGGIAAIGALRRRRRRAASVVTVAG